MFSVPVLDTLPHEILGYIMTATLHSYPDLESQHRFLTTMLLTSRRLQRIAFSTPRLWTTLLIGLPINVEAVASCLKRSGALPLWIEIGWTDEVGEVRNVDRLANMLHQEAHRLAGLCLQCPFEVDGTDQAQDFVNALLPSGLSLPMLGQLILDVTGQLFGSVVTLTSHCTPKLEYLKCRGIGPQVTIWSNGDLKELYVIDCEAKPLQHLAELLGAFPRLRMVHLEEFEIATSGFDLERTTILMPELEVFRLLKTTVLDCNIILGVLMMPDLRVLVLGGGEDRFRGQAWVPLHKSFPKLQDLSIVRWSDCMDDDRPFLEDIVHSCPNVTRFRFDSLYSAFADHLPPVPFPKLRHLATHVFWRDPFHISLLPHLISLDHLSIDSGTLAAGSEDDFARHQRYMRELREDFNVSIYGDITQRGGSSKNRELMQEWMCLTDANADAPKDEFLEMW